MTGERYKARVEVMARARARMQHLKNLIDDLYVDTEQVITREEYENEQEVYGHTYDQDCTSPFCTKVRRMYQTALQQAQGVMTNG